MAFVCLLLTFCFFLQGCRAMDTRDLDGSLYQNEQQRFYVPGKNAKLRRYSYAYRWKSGDLEGFCSEKTERKALSDDSSTNKVALRNERVLVDNIVFSDIALFDTASQALTLEGKQVLDQLLARAGGYQDVRRIEIEGHTDSRGTQDYNQQLSEDRSSAVRNYLLSRMKKKLPILTRSSGELKPVANNKTKSGMKRNRRVEAKIVALNVSPENTNSTLCYLAPGHPTDKPPPLLGAAHSSTNSNDKWQLEKYRGQLPVSVGDHIKIGVAADDSFNGIYEVTIGGGIDLPLLGSVPVHGLSVSAIKKSISEKLVEKSLVRPYAATVDTSVQQWSAIDVYVRGAVFQEGRFTINSQKPETRVFINSRNTGDYARDRLLSMALYEAGGIRPDADLASIQVLRSGKIINVDLSGLIDGELARDFPLIAGDEVIVPSTGYFQSALVKPSQMTPPGIRLFMSNPTVPIYNNTSAAIDKDVFNVPYGTRFLRGLITANCVGGTQQTNASRRGVLISTNPVTRATEVIERSVQQLISDPDRDDINPFLMPNDGIACYDSNVSNIRDVARTISDILAPFVDLSGIFSDR